MRFIPGRAARELPPPPRHGGVHRGVQPHPAPSGWLARAGQAQSDPYGAWIVVSPPAGGTTLEGELLAIDRDSVFVLTAVGAVRSEALDPGSRAVLAFYDAGTTDLTTWTALGALSTISNGHLLIFTLPAWAIRWIARDPQSIARAAPPHRGGRRLERGAHVRSISGRPATGPAAHAADEARRRARSRSVRGCGSAQACPGVPGT